MYFYFFIAGVLPCLILICLICKDTHTYLLHMLQAIVHIAFVRIYFKKTLGSQLSEPREVTHWFCLHSSIKIHQGAVVCTECDLKGDITIGKNTVVHPKAQIIAEAGPIIIGENNLIEEQVQIINKYGKK